MKYTHLLYVLMVILCLASVSALEIKINATAGDQAPGVAKNIGGSMIWGGQTFAYNGGDQMKPQLIQMYVDVVGQVPFCFVQIYATAGGFPTGTPLMNSSEIVCTATVGSKTFVMRNDSFVSPLIGGNTYAVVINTTETLTNNNYSYFTYRNTPGYSGGAQIIKTGLGAWGNGDAGYDFNLTIFGDVYVPVVPDYPLAFTVTSPTANTQTNTTLPITWTNATNTSAITYTLQQYFTSNNSLVRTIATVSNGSLYNNWIIPQSQSNNYTVRINGSNIYGSYIANSTTFVIDAIPPVCVTPGAITGDSLVSYQVNFTDDYQLRNYTYSCTNGSTGTTQLPSTSLSTKALNMTITQNASCTYMVRDWLWNTSCTQTFVYNGSLPPPPNVTNSTYVFSLITTSCTLSTTTLLDYRMILLFSTLVLCFYLYKIIKSIFILLPLFAIAIYIFVGLYYCDSVIAFLFLVVNIATVIVFTEYKIRR